jgi:hypothetical protein
LETAAGLIPCEGEPDTLIPEMGPDMKQSIAPLLVFSDERHGKTEVSISPVDFLLRYGVSRQSNCE